MINRGFFAVLFLVSVHAVGQQLAVDAFLKSALADPAVSGFEPQLEWFGRRDYRLPWANELEFRTQNNVMMFGRQQYRLRLELANPFQVRTNNAWFETQNELKKIQYRVVLGEVLRDRYLLLVDWLTLRDRAMVAAKIVALCKARVKALEALSGSSYFDANNYADARVDLVTRSADATEAEHELALAEERIVRGSALRFDFNVKPVGPEQIAGIADTLSVRLDVSSVREQLLERQVQERKVKLDKSRLSFGWIQGQYVPYREGTGTNPTGFSAGVTIPVFQKNKDDVARSQLRVLEENARLEELKSETMAIQHEKMAGLRMALSRYKHLRLMSDSLIYLFESPERLMSKNMNPDAEYRIQIQFARLQLPQLAEIGRIRKEWIELLHELDLLAAEPWLNYLSEDLRPVNGN